MSTEFSHLPPHSDWTPGRILLLAAIVGLPAVINLLAWPLSKSTRSTVAVVMLCASLPLSLFAGLIAGLAMSSNHRLLLLWIPVLTLLSLAVSVGLQFASVAATDPEILFQ
jgi:hypothetical protein